MSSTVLALLIKPFAVLLIFGVVLIPARLAVIKWCPEGRIKRLLLTRVDGHQTGDGQG
jgi:hypothetical protein